MTDIGLEKVEMDVVTVPYAYDIRRRLTFRRYYTSERTMFPVPEQDED